MVLEKDRAPCDHGLEAYIMKFSSNPDWTGEIGMMPPELQQIYGSRWIFTADQWKIVSRIVTRAMFAAGPPHEPDNVIPPGGEIPPYHPPPNVTSSAAMLVNALMLDPYKIYGSVRWASIIRWANYACLATWFHWLSDEGRVMFCNDVKTGNVNRWLPAVRDVAMARCPKEVWSSLAYFSAKSILAADANPWSTDADVTNDTRDNSYVDVVWSEARVGTAFEHTEQHSFFGGIPSLPLDLLCQPFPMCMLEGLFGTGSMPAEVNPVSGRVEYKQQSPYPGTPGGEQPPAGCSNPQGRLVSGALIGGALGLGAALLFGSKLVGSLMGVAGGAVVGATVGSLTGPKGCLQVADKTVGA